MSNDVRVNFSVGTASAKNEIAGMQRAASGLSQSNLDYINKQIQKTKEQNKLIADQIALLTKKSGLELQIERNLLNQQRQRVISNDRAKYDAELRSVMNNSTYSNDDKLRLSAQIRQNRADAERQANQYYDNRIAENKGDLRGAAFNQRLRKQQTANEIELELLNKQKKEKERNSPLLNTALENSYDKQGRERLQFIEEQINDLAKGSREGQATFRKNLSSNYKQALRDNRSFFANRRKDIADAGFMNETDHATAYDEIKSQEKAMARGIGVKYAQNLTSAKEAEKQSKMQTALAVEQINTIKQTAAADIKAIQSGDTKLSSVLKNASTDTEKLIAELTRQGLSADRKQTGGGSAVLQGFGMLMAAGAAKDYINIRNQNALSKDGFDVLGNDKNSIARIGGAILGGAIAGLFTDGFGIAAGAAAGSELVGSWVGGLTDQQRKQAVSRQEYFKNLNLYRATTGDLSDNIFPSMSKDDMENTGTTINQYLQLRNQYARLRGNRNAADSTITDSIYLGRGFGVDQGSSAAVIEMMRMFKDPNSSLANFIGGVLQKGQNNYFKNGDTSFLNEFLNKFITVQKQLLQNQTRVNTGSTFDILSRFNQVGGAFSTSDPRSTGLMSTVNNAISNPQGDFARAMMMYSIRKAHPEITNPYELEKYMQRGSNGDNLQSLFNTVQQGGGADWSKKRMFAGLTGLGGSLSMNDDLYAGLRRGIFKGKLSNRELNAAIPGLKSRAEGNVAPIEVNQARNENAWLTDKQADDIGKSISSAVKESLLGSVIDVQNGKITLKSHQAVTKEASVRDAKQAEQDKYNYSRENQSIKHGY